MPTSHLVLDLGSHSVKLYVCDDKVEQIDTVTWQLLEHKMPQVGISATLKYLLNKWNIDGSDIYAIGTEAMRRDSCLEVNALLACQDLGIKYKTISQTEEAEMIQRAAHNAEIPQNFDIINVGGGSIQIVSHTGTEIHLLPFGISDLNERFSLSAPSRFRKIQECLAWVMEQLPASVGDFAYTGGERAYILHLGGKLNGRLCEKSTFLGLAQSLSFLEAKDLESLSPFDPGWMRGAIASNCIVLACLEKSGSQSFLPLDINLAHGIISVI